MPAPLVAQACFCLKLCVCFLALRPGVMSRTHDKQDVSIRFVLPYFVAQGISCHAGDEEARARGTQKSVLERKAPPTFPLVIEMRERAYWVTHWVEDSVDCLLHAKVPVVQARYFQISTDRESL